ncbi:MAG: hypothetical protein ACI8VW_002367 [bacterium]|jgi:hypothetical protein
MVSKVKLYSQLDSMEDELRERVVPHLENAVKGNNNLIFCTTDFKPFPKLNYRADSETDALIQLGRQILALKEKLGESSEGTIAERICWYCRKWGDTGDSHQEVVQGLAKDFLQELRNANN